MVLSEPRGKDKDLGRVSVFVNPIVLMFCNAYCIV